MSSHNSAPPRVRVGQEPWHGTLNGYSNLGCRCAECRAAHAADARTWRAKQRRLREAEQAAAALLQPGESE